MKRQTARTAMAPLIRGAFCLLLLATVIAIPLASGQREIRAHSTLTFVDRVAYQRAIEEVYWRHRIWPKENPNPKPPLDAVMPQAELKKNRGLSAQVTGAAGLLANANHW